MKKKELSNYAPDRWIRVLNRTFPNLWVELRKTWEHPENVLPIDSEGRERLKEVPDWCYMATMMPFLLYTSKFGEPFYLRHIDEMMTIGTLYTWRASKGVYRFAPEIYHALINQQLTGNLPIECLFRLPEWAVYIETPGLFFEKRAMEGFIAHLDYNLYSRGNDLQFAIFAKEISIPKMIALPLGEGTLLDAMDRIDQVDDEFLGGSREARHVVSREEYKTAFSAMLQLILYLCSEEPDMPEIEHPKNRKRLSGAVRAPEEPRIWDVGVRISNAIRNYNQCETRQSDVKENKTASTTHHARPRPHVRSAHWHTYWTGPRKATFPERKPVVRWIPPIPIGVEWKKEMPTNIHIIK